MNSFDFNTVPRLEMMWSGASQLGSLLAARVSARQALLVSDAGLVAAGVVEPVLRSLEGGGFDIRLFDRIVADPPESVLMDCVGAASGCDLVIGLGGGSSLDVAKLAAVMLRTPQDLSAMAGIDKVAGERLPLVLIPTTAGTGSEVTNIAIITTGGLTKTGVVAPQLYADYVLLDAALTVGLPPIHTAATGIDAMVHAIEAYTGRVRKNPISDALAREALRLLCRNLVTACADGKDRGAREGMLLGATLAGQAFANSPVGAVHALAYPLGGHYHIPHGLSNALMLVPVLRFNARAAAPLYAELADVLLGVGPGEIRARADRFVEAMDGLLNRSGAPRRLRDVGVTRDSLPVLAADAMKQTRLLGNNPVDLLEADALGLYIEAF
ncbi:MAG: iron-containing alcohol dehydrogenase [Telmatospirillum sp.]|nr:iron-containing alcohol dehydrogenase [Telmatospirillum sp.]